MRVTYTSNRSCGHTTTGWLSLCRPFLARLLSDRDQPPHPDECPDLHPRPPQDTPMKCNDCHVEWSLAQQATFDHFRGVVLTGLARGHEDLENWLREQRAPQRNAYGMEMGRWDLIVRDADGRTVYDSYPGAIMEQLNPIAAWIGEEVAAREQEAAVEGSGEDGGVGGEDEELQEEM